MRMYGKSLTEITETDLQQLVEDGQEENLRLEFKVDCYHYATEEEKQKKRHEFVKDVLALANASGGWIICGVAENAGKARRIIGIDNFNPDMHKRQLGTWLDRDAEPLIGQFSTHTVTLSNARSVFVIEVPRSFAAPHRNKHTGEFPIRRLGRVDYMDVDDLRRAFVGTAAFADQIRAFRRERINAILDPNHPNNLAPIDDGPVFAVHLLPLGMVENSSRFSVTSLEFAERALGSTQDGYYYLNRSMHNLDGVILPTRQEKSTAMEYMQVFRSGAVEYVETNSHYLEKRDVPLNFHDFECRVLRGLAFAIRLQRSLDLLEPCFVGISVARVEGFRWKANHRSGMGNSAAPIKHQRLVLPEQYVEGWTQTPEAIMKPTFDIWANALGWPKSPNYDANGTWIKPHGCNLPSIDLT